MWSRSLPREGVLNSGLEYYVHDIGYTVVMPSEAQVHIDTGLEVETDLFSDYDTQAFLNTAEDGSLPTLTIEEVRGAAVELVSRGVLVEVKDWQFALSGWAYDKHANREESDASS